MAVITYTQTAVLSAYQTWLMEQGAQACLERIVRPLEPPGAPSALCGPYAQAGSQIRYTVTTTLATATVSFSGQFRTVTGAWQNMGESVTATSAGGATQVVRPATAGSYANMVASVGAATVGAGEVYVVAELGRQNNGAFTPYAVLFKGYPESNAPLDLCAGTFLQNPPSTGGGGNACVCPSTFEIRDIGDIVAPQGVQANFTPAAGTVERIVNITGYALMGATVGNRSMFAEFIAFGAGPVMQIQTATTIPANADAGILGYIDRASDFTDGNYFNKTIPGGLWWSTTYQVQIGIIGFQAGDEIAQGFIIVETRT